ncbi:uncharacterized protein METZ01_LOCUS323238, partial [marine metagenome]
MNNIRNITLPAILLISGYCSLDAQDLCPPMGLYGSAGNEQNVLSWHEPGQIACGDFMVDAIPYYHQGSNVGMSDDWPVTGSQGADVSYTLVVTDTITVDVSLCADSTNYDCKLEIFTNDNTCLNPDTTGYYDDDGPDCAIEEPDQQYEPSFIGNATLAPGLYYIVVDGYAGAEGNYGLSITTSGTRSSDTAENTIKSDRLLEQIKMAEMGYSQEEIDSYHYNNYIQQQNANRPSLTRD